MDSKGEAIEFQLTASQGDWLYSDNCKNLTKVISTHSLTRRLTDWLRHSSRNTIFQLTASQGGWHRFSNGQMGRWHFNSQPHKEADSLWRQYTGLGMYFNSQPHKEADGRFNQNSIRINISTHSLTRRLTIKTTKTIILVIFQLTASQGGWLQLTYYWPPINLISTHSLTRRLTVYRGSLGIYPNNFNSQPHKEADRTPDFSQYSEKISTHSLTRRLTIQPVNHLFSAEISTHSLTRRLTSASTNKLSALTFQLTASQGGWRKSCAYVARYMLFQLTASQGGWLLLHVMRGYLSIFQLTASQGGWPNSTLPSSISTNFNSQPHKEADQSSKCRIQRTIKFQLTASQGGWRRFSSRNHSFQIISTHSLTRRLTSSICWVAKARRISTHSITRRLTGYEGREAPWPTFQLTASQGGWRNRPYSIS